MLLEKNKKKATSFVHKRKLFVGVFGMTYFGCFALNLKSKLSVLCKYLF